VVLPPSAVQWAGETTFAGHSIITTTRLFVELLQTVHLMTSDLEMLLTLMGRYLHIVAATLLVGGTLFYEMVVPIAIEDLIEEQKLLVFARARWVFKGIVWTAVVLIVLTGAVNTWDHWPEYARGEYVTATTSRPEVASEPAASRPGWWWAAHASTGVVAVLVALSLTMGSVPPARPIRWMRLNLIVLLLVMFLASATRQARLQAFNNANRGYTPRSGLTER